MRLRAIIELPVEVQVVVGRKALVEADIIWDEPNQPPYLEGVGTVANLVPRHPCGTARFGYQAGEHSDCGGLSRPVGAQEPENLALAYLEGESVNGSEVAESPGEILRLDHVDLPRTSIVAA